MTVLSAAVLLFLVMDPFGNAPVFISVLKDVPPGKKHQSIIRELLIALVVLILFLLIGPPLLSTLQISAPSLRIAGGIILFLIAIKMIFGSQEDLFGEKIASDPIIVPLAIPSLAGPSAIATVMLLTGQEPERWSEWLLALILSWLATSFILLLTAKFDRIIGEQGMNALQNLMGLILTALAVEMFLGGIRSAFHLV